jgi:hypothetical protein
MVDQSSESSEDLQAISGDLIPALDNVYVIGTPALRWKEIVTGDLIFSDEKCLNCNRPFGVGDRIVLKVIAKDEKGNSRTVPIHQEACR